MSYARSNPSTSNRRELCRLCRLALVALVLSYFADVRSFDALVALRSAGGVGWHTLHRSARLLRRPWSLQAPGRCRGSRRVLLEAAPFIEDQRGVLLKALCKSIFVVRYPDKDFEA